MVNNQEIVVYYSSATGLIGKVYEFKEKGFHCDVLNEEQLKWLNNYQNIVAYMKDGCDLRIEKYMDNIIRSCIISRKDGIDNTINYELIEVSSEDQFMEMSLLDLDRKLDKHNRKSL